MKKTPTISGFFNALRVQDAMTPNGQRSLEIHH